MVAAPRAAAAAATTRTRSTLTCGPRLPRRRAKRRRRPRRRRRLRGRGRERQRCARSSGARGPPRCRARSPMTLSCAAPAQAPEQTGLTLAERIAQRFARPPPPPPPAHRAITLRALCSAPLRRLGKNAAARRASATVAAVPPATGGTSLPSCVCVRARVRLMLPAQTSRHWTCPPPISCPAPSLLRQWRGGESSFSRGGRGRATRRRG